MSVAGSNDWAIDYWKSTDHIAAKARLELARHYQHQFERLDDEFANLRASRFWLVHQRDEQAAHLLIAYVKVLSPYLRQRGLGGELLRWCGDGLHACEKVEHDLGWLLLLKGEAQNMLGQWDEALASFQIAIGASKEKNCTHARAVLALGCLQLNQGDYNIALQTLARAEELLSEQLDYEGLATARSEVAAYHLNRHDLDQALALYLEVDQLRQRAGAMETSDHMLLMLGVVYRKLGDYERANNYLQQLIERGEARNNQGAVATASHHLAWVRLNQGNLAEARRLCGRAIALYEEIGDTRGTSDAYEQLGLIALAEGQGDEALFHLEKSLDIRRQLGNQHGAASSLRRLAVARLKMGQLIDAVGALCQSLAIYRRIGMLTRHRLAVIVRELFDWAMERRQWTV